MVLRGMVHEICSAIAAVNFFPTERTKSGREVFFRNTVLTDGFSVCFLFSRKKRTDDILDQRLELDDFVSEEVDGFFRPCAVDPGITNVLTASFGHGGTEHEIRKFSGAEYYATTGSPRRNKELDKEKHEAGIKDIESRFPTCKTANRNQYSEYVQYFFLHRQRLFDFYGQRRPEHIFTITKVVSEQ